VCVRACMYIYIYIYIRHKCRTESSHIQSGLKISSAPVQTRTKYVLNITKKHYYLDQLHQCATKISSSSAVVDYIVKIKFSGLFRSIINPGTWDPLDTSISVNSLIRDRATARPPASQDNTAQKNAFTLEYIHAQSGVRTV
jgi:hypothetical protein